METSPWPSAASVVEADVDVDVDVAPAVGVAADCCPNLAIGSLVLGGMPLQ